jgi:hypothetical protein
MRSVKVVIDISMEAERVLVEAAASEQWDGDLVQRIEGMPECFIFNVDEIGTSDFDDSPEVKVARSIEQQGNMVPIRADWHSRKVMLAPYLEPDVFLM